MTTPILPAAAVSSQLRNHSNYDQEFKKKVIIAAEKSSNREAEKMFGISESNIRRWRKMKGEIFGFGPSNLDKNKDKRRVIQMKGKLQKQERLPSFIVEELKVLANNSSGSMFIFFSFIDFFTFF